MKQDDIKQISADLAKLSNKEFQEKYHTSGEELKGLNKQELEKRVSKMMYNDKLYIPR